LSAKPLPTPHHLPPVQLVRFPPGLDADRGDAEVAVGGGELARVEAGLGGEGVAEFGGDVGSIQWLRRADDEDDIAGRAEADAHLASGLQVAAGRAGRRGGDQQRLAVPEVVPLALSAVAIQASTPCLSRWSVSRLRCAVVRGGTVI
jgi:hypothetical protein